MEIIDFITQNFTIVSGFLVVLISLGYLLIKKAMPSQTELAKIVGVSDSVLSLIIQIFKQVEYNHVKFNNETLKTNKVELSDKVAIPEQKMKVAVQAMSVLLPKKNLAKIGDLFEFAQHAYKWLKPLFKSKK